MMETMKRQVARKIEVVDFPAVILVDDKGHDFFCGYPEGEVE